MTEQQVKLEFTRYLDDEGNPVCAIDVPNGRCCQFLGTKHFGMVEVCMFPGLGRDDEGKLQRRMPPSVAYLAPHENCPLWKKGITEVETRCSLCGSPFRLEKCTRCGRQFCQDHLYCNPSSNGTWTPPKCGGCIGFDDSEKKKD